MNKRISGIVVTALAAMTAWSVQAQTVAPTTVQQAVELGSTESCVIPKVDGERVPFPRAMKANTKFELAEGESYILEGRIVMLSGRVFLQVDLEEQPWLATAGRKAFPYFELNQIDPSSIQVYSNRTVQVAVVTSRKPVSMQTAYDTNLQLNMVVPPILLQKY